MAITPQKKGITEDIVSEGSPTGDYFQPVFSYMDVTNRMCVIWQCKQYVKHVFILHFTLLLL